MATTYAKQFSDIIGDFDSATQSAFGALKKGADAGKGGEDPRKLKEEMKDLDKMEDDLLAGLDQLTRRVMKCLGVYDFERKELESEIKQKSANDKGPPEHADDFDKSYETLKKVLEKFTVRVKSDMGGRKDLGDKFPRAAAALFTDLKRLQVDLKKDAAKLLNKAEGADDDAGVLEVEPTTFSIDFKKIIKDIAKDFKDAKGDDPKVAKFKDAVRGALENAEDRLHRLDTNHSFDKVAQLCDVAVGAIKSAVKALSADREYSSTGSELLKMVHEIDAYDKKMFLFSRLKG